MINPKFILSILWLMLLVNFCEAKGAKKLIIADQKINCAGAFECIQIKEKGKDAWRVYADTIAGFNYEEGYEYKISVQSEQTKNTLAGLYDENYKLIKILSKRKTNYVPIIKLQDKKWILQSMYDAHSTTNLDDITSYIKVNSINGRMNGRGVCNNFTGAVKIQGTSISFGEILSTKMMCKGIELEKTILFMLKESTTYKIEGSTLLLLSADGKSMTFKAE